MYKLLRNTLSLYVSLTFKNAGPNLAVTIFCKAMQSSYQNHLFTHLKIHGTGRQAKYVLLASTASSIRLWKFRQAVTPNVAEVAANQYCPHIPMMLQRNHVIMNCCKFILHAYLYDVVA